VPVGVAAGKVAVRMLDHPIGKVWRQPALCVLMRVARIAGDDLQPSASAERFQAGLQPRILWGPSDHGADLVAPEGAGSFP